MAEFRVWHASRDPYHCVYRLVRLMAAKAEPVAVEKLRLLDMFLLFPGLLHRMSLPIDVKRRFRELRIETPAKGFIRLPSTAAVWQDLQIYQSTALKQLAARGMLKRDALRDRYASLDTEHVPFEVLDRAKKQNAQDVGLVEFLVRDIAALPTTGKSGFVRRAGLPARGPVL